MDNNRPHQGHQSKNPPHQKGRGKGKSAPLGHAESARLVHGVAMTRQPLGDDARRLPIEWQEAELLATELGMEGVATWIKTLHIRYAKDPAGLAVFLDAWQGAESGSAVVAVESPPDPPKPPRFKVYGASELSRTDFRPEWLCRGVLVKGQPCVVGAAKKGLKTTQMVEMGVSLASATPFLGRFDIPRRTTVLFMSGESGGVAIQDTTRRVCDAKDIGMEVLEGRYFVSFDLPRLSAEEDLQSLGDLIGELKAEVVIIDPLYLCLVGGDRPVDPANLYQTGPLLSAVARRCLDAGATPVLVHHFKQGVGEPYAPPELGNLAFSGIQEFARQWILLGRRSRYVPGSGFHDLWLTVGGSSGHSGEWAVDVNEGTIDDDFSGRTWNVTVKSGTEIRAEEQEAKTAAQEAKEREKEIARRLKLKSYEDAVLEAIVKLGGKGTRTKICDTSGLSGTNSKGAIARLVAEGRLVDMTVLDGRGRPTDGVGLPNPDTLTDP